MSWSRRWAFASLLAAFVLGGAVVWVEGKGKRRPESSPSALPTLAAIAEGSLPVPEPTPVAEQLGAQPRDPVLAAIRHSLLPVSTENGVGGPLPVAGGESQGRSSLALPLPALPQLASGPDQALPSSQPAPPLGLPEPPPLAPVPAPLAPPTSPALRVPPPVPSSPPSTPPSTAAPVACPWTLHLEIVEGRTQIEARSGNEVHFQVSCARLDLQAPHGCLQAQGTVKVSGAGLEGTCDRLTISWDHNKVLLEGNVHLSCHKEGQEVELAADRLSVRLNTLLATETSEAVEILTVAPKLKTED